MNWSRQELQQYLLRPYGGGGEDRGKRGRERGRGGGGVER